MSNPTNRYSVYGRIKEVCGHDLEKAYDDGWRLIEMIAYQETDLRSEPCNVCSGNASYGQGTAYHGLVYTKPRYLVGKRYDDELAKSQGELITELGKRKQVQDSLEAKTRDYNEASRERDKYQERWNTQSAERDSAVKRAQLMEEHIGRAKKHFGEKAWQDAIDEQDDNRRD